MFTTRKSSGSSDLFLPGPNCGSTCLGHQIYDPNSSSTAENQNKSFSLGFIDNSTAQCDLFTDTVSVAGLTVKPRPDCPSVFSLIVLVSGEESSYWCGYAVFKPVQCQ
jgi:hypothetical protein